MASIRKLLRNHYVVGAIFGALLGAICLFTSATIHYSMFGCGGAESVKTPLIALDSHCYVSRNADMYSRIHELASQAYWVLLAQEFVTKGFDTITRFAALTVLGLLLCDKLQFWLRGQRAVYLFVSLVSGVQVFSALALVPVRRDYDICFQDRVGDSNIFLHDPIAAWLLALAIAWQLLGFLLICWSGSPIYSMSPFRKCSWAFWIFSLPLFLVVRMGPMFLLGQQAAQYCPH